MSIRYVSYLRVSRDSQGIDGLGMDAQREAVRKFLEGGDRILICEVRECETGKIKVRPQLKIALELCRKEGAVLLIARLCRLSRNAAFLLNLQESGVKFVAVDMPHADNFTVGIMALVAQKERERISDNTRLALQALKKRGVKLGNARWGESIGKARKARAERANTFAKDLVPIIESIHKAGVSSLRGACQCLTARGIKTTTGKDFAPQTLKNYLERAGSSLYLAPVSSILELPKE
jgi:DNA invertase Pin-like site-specific DNA recombinase